MVVLTESRVGKQTCGAEESRRCRQLVVHSCFTRDQLTWHLDDYHCTLLCGMLRDSFKETASRKTAENTAKHRSGGVDSVVANHRGGGESSMVVTTLVVSTFLDQFLHHLQVQGFVQGKQFTPHEALLTLVHMNSFSSSNNNTTHIQNRMNAEYLQRQLWLTSLVAFLHATCSS